MNVDHAEYTEGTLAEAGRDSLRDRSDDVALSRNRVGDPRLISLIRRYLEAGVLEDGKVYLPIKG
jgi:hypothetical protein